MRKFKICFAIAMAGLAFAPAPSFANGVFGVQFVTAGPTADPYVNWVMRRRQSLGQGDMAAITNEICMAARGGVIVAIPCSYRAPAPAIVAVVASPGVMTDGVIYSPYVPRLSPVVRFRAHAHHARFCRRWR